VFVPGKLLQPSLTFVGKAYPRVEHLKSERLSTVIMTKNPFFQGFSSVVVLLPWLARRWWLFRHFRFRLHPHQEPVIPLRYDKNKLECLSLKYISIEIQSFPITFLAIKSIPVPMAPGGFEP
jgi:hypothetical protein